MARRGESLVEVVVSCGVIMLVFSGVVTMIIQSIGLNASSRARTQAVIEAQTEMNKFIVSGKPIESDPGTEDNTHEQTDGGSCQLGWVSPNPQIFGEDWCKVAGTEDPDGTEVMFQSNLDSAGKSSCAYVEAAEQVTDTDNPNKDERSAKKVEDGTIIADVIPLGRYMKIKVHVKWLSRGLGVQEYILTRLVSK